MHGQDQKEVEIISILDRGTILSEIDVYDLNTTYRWKNAEASILAQNIFNKAYFENTFVPMPKGNVLFGLKFYFQ